MSDSIQRLSMARMVPLRETRERDFDHTFWQAQGPAAIVNSAWEMVETYLRSKGRSDELRLQRSVVGFRKLRD